MNSFDSLPDGAAVGAYLSGAAPSMRDGSASAGFGSPGSDVTVKRIDLNDALIHHREATFVMRAAGVDMHSAGIDDGDALLVDRALQPQPGNVVIAAVDGELVCRRLGPQGRLLRDTAAATEHADAAPAEIWGVVTTVIKSLLG